MHMLAKFGDHRLNRNGDINSYMDTLEKPELTASICHIAIFIKSETRIYNSYVSDRQAEIREEEKEEHSQMQNVMLFMQTQ